MRVTRVEEKYRTAPVRGKRFYGYFFEFLEVIASGSAQKGHEVLAVPLDLGRTDAADLLQLGRRTGFGLGDRLERLVREDDVRGDLVLGRAGQPPLLEPGEQLLVVRRRAVT